MKKTVAAAFVACLTAASFAMPAAAAVVVKIKPAPVKKVIIVKPACHWRTVKVMTNHKVVIKKTRVCK